MCLIKMLKILLSWLWLWICPSRKPNRLKGLHSFSLFSWGGPWVPHHRDTFGVLITVGASPSQWWSHSGFRGQTPWVGQKNMKRKEKKEIGGSKVFLKKLFLERFARTQGLRKRETGGDNPQQKLWGRKYASVPHFPRTKTPYLSLL